MGDTQNQNQTQNNSLPFDLITSEILPKLNTKPLTRFKSVSKQWNTLISSPSFTKLHLQLHYLTSQCLFISNDKFLTFKYLSLENKVDPDEDLVKIDLGSRYFSEIIEFSFTHNEGMFIVGCCDGLVCVDFGYQSRISDYVYVWNPSIRALRSVPSFIVRDEKKFSDILDPPKFRKQDFICGFGGVSESNDYKIVYVTEEKGNGRKRGYVFGLKANSWRKIRQVRVFHGYYIDPKCYVSVLVDETLFWRMVKVSNANSKGWCIVGCDLVDEKFSEVGVPEWLRLKSLDFELMLCALKERLSVYWFDGSEMSMNIVMSMDYRNLDSWKKLVKFDCQYLSPCNFFGFTRSEQFLVHIDGAHVRLVDVSQDPATSEKIMKIGPGEDIVSYVESLVSPFNLKEE